MKKIIPLLSLVVLIAGCATTPTQNETATQERKQQTTPLQPKVNGDLGLSLSQQQTAESRH